METWLLAMGAFVITVVLVLWRPWGIHEAVPAMAGAFVMFLVGLIQHGDVITVLTVVWNAAMTIISTFVMASVLEGAGFFDWVGDRLIDRSGGSSRRLFHLVLAFSACLTLFLNNDGSILLGTPVVIGLVKRLKMNRRMALGFLIGACLIASVSSPPIGVSNMANLEAMGLVGITLNEHLRVVVLPALVGLVASWLLLHAVFTSTLSHDLSGGEPDEAPEPARSGVNESEHSPLPSPPPPPPPPVPPPPPPPHLHSLRPAPPPPHPPRPLLPPPSPHHAPGAPPCPASGPAAEPPAPPQPDYPFMWFAVGVVVLVRAGFFAASLAGIPTYLVAAAGAGVLLVGNLHRRVVDTGRALRQAPWPILAFAFGMDLVVFGIRNAGITTVISHWMGPAVKVSPAAASFLPGLISAGSSALVNNHPGLITSSLMLLDIPSLARSSLDVAYSAVVLGSDIGALLVPIGTLASLIWFHILQQNGLKYSWWDYLKVTLAVIPVSFILSLLTLWGMAVLMVR